MPLFGKKKQDNKKKGPQIPAAQNETTYFGKNLKIKGRVSGNGNLIILGTLNGEFRLKGRLKIAQSAKIKGEVNADIISVNGNVNGSLNANDRVHLDQTARIQGRIHTPKLSIMDGAVFDGEVNMGAQAPKSDNATRSETDRSTQVTQPAAEKSTSG